mgnify:CR=1 FL=1
MKRSQEISILVQDYCTREEAKKHLDNGAFVISKRDFKKNFESYMSEWDYSEDEKAEVREMIRTEKPLPDWGVAKYNGGTYFIAYVL